MKTTISFSRMILPNVNTST